ncbi:MAG: gliding motility-associated C-terminal domain-containing protein [Flavobacteriales bacterium]
MKKILGLFVGIFFLATASAQIVAVGHAGSSLTAYTNGAVNDSIYFYCTGQTGSLSAEATTGTAPYDYTWYKFNSTTVSFGVYQTDTDVASSAISNLTPGAYKLTITDANGVVVGCDRAWIAEILTNPSVDVADIAPGCGSFQLNGSITYGTATPYYNLPNDDMIIDADTQISICFTGTHTFVSDLAFYVVGPSSCGSPTLLLSPNPGAIGQGTICNSGDNINNLCFSTESTANLNVCASVPSTLSGTYGSYGPSSTPINWALLNGCNAANGGWKVQIYDCISGDVGALTDATLTFVDTDLCGQPLTISYTTPSGFSSTISDNTCSAATASVYTVPSATTAAIPYTNSFLWTASPTMAIPGAAFLLAPTVNPSVETTYTLTIGGNGPKGWCGGSSSDSETRQILGPVAPVIDPVNSFYCLFDPAFNLTATPAGGTWSGTGVSAAGLFTPSAAGAGPETLTYTFTSGSCSASSTITIDIWPTANPVITDPGLLCLNNNTTIDLSASPAGGIWSGDGITDETTGIFDPAVVGVGDFTVTYTVPNACLNSDTQLISISEVPEVNLSDPGLLCFESAPINLTATPAGGTWSGTGVTAAGLFTPSEAGVGLETLTYTYTSGGCSSSSTITLDIWPTANPVITDPGLICLNNNTTIDLSASPAGGIWSGDGITDETTGIFDPAVVGVGDFTVTYTVPNACLNTDTQSITISEAPAVNLTDPGLLCIESTPINLTADYAGGTWSGNGITDANLGTFDPSTTGIGSSTVTYSVNDGCPIEVDLTIDVVSSVDATITDIEPLCESSAAVQLVAASAGGVWSGSGVSSTGLFTPSLAGTGDIEVTYTISGSCFGEDQSTIEVQPIPSVSFLNDGSFCAGGASEMLTATTSGGTWSGTGITNGATGMFSPVTSGVGTFTINYSIGGLCPVSQNQTITVHALPTVSAGADTEICAGGSTNISASGASSYQWTATGFTSNNQSASVQPNVTTTYTVTGTDSFGCQNSDNVTVTVNALPVVTASTTGAVCEDECAVLSATGLASYSWTPASTLTGANTNSPTACPGSTTTYTVSGVDANGCSGSAQVTQIVTQINVSISASPTEGFAPIDINFFVSSNADDFNWTFGNGATANTNSSTETPTMFYDSEGFYTVTVTANLDGCSETDEMEVIVFNFSTIKIPNVVTTNNDGLNDAYRVQGNWIEDFNMQIYNRYGALVGELKDVDEVAPNGFDYDDSYDTWNPGENSDGTYFFHYKAVGYDGKVYENTGSITVLSVK